MTIVTVNINNLMLQSVHDDSVNIRHGFISYNAWVYILYLSVSHAGNSSGNIPLENISVRLAT